MKLPNVGFITRLKLFGSHVRGFGILDRENKKYIHIFICSHLRLVCLYLKLKRDKWIWHAASKEWNMCSPKRWYSHVCARQVTSAYRTIVWYHEAEYVHFLTVLKTQQRVRRRWHNVFFMFACHQIHAATANDQRIYWKSVTQSNIRRGGITKIREMLKQWILVL